MSAFRTTGLILLLALALGRGLLAEDSAERGERWDRNVDRAALSAQRQAIQKYGKLVKKYARTDQERPLRIRLIESLEGAANLEFRIAHGEAHLKKQSVDLSKYHATLKDVIETSTSVIKLAPGAEDAHRIYFVRAQAFGELKKIADAKKDYHFIADKYSATTWAIRSNMALAGYATEEGSHKLAIELLKRVEKFPNDPHYPYALYQIAWAYYNLNDIPAALDYLRQNITYYKKKLEDSEEKKLAQSESAALDHSLKDVVTFFFEGFTKKLAGYELKDALPLFRKIESGPPFGMMFVFFAKQLRSRDLVEDLGSLQTQILAEESARPEAIEVVMAHVESLHLRRAYDRIVPAAMGFKQLDDKTKGEIRKLGSFVAAQKLILQVADGVQKAISTTKVPEQSLKLSRTLVGVYGAFTAIVEETDPRLVEIHYNLGETLFSIKEFDTATPEYVWVLKHWQSSAKLKKPDVSLKAISSRYQSISQKNLLPTELKLAKISERKDPELKDLKPLIGEWIGWVDEYLDDYGRTPKAFENFEFEANRLLYSEGQTRPALSRLQKAVKDNPQASVAQAEASLILDTYVFDKQWELLLDVSELFLDIPKLGDDSFRKRLDGLPADASLKLIEASYESKDFVKVLAQADRFQKRYGKSPRLADSLFLASRAADQLGEKEKALVYVSELLTRFPKTEKRSVALLARATLEDATLDFDAAARDYQDYLASLPKGKDGPDRRSLFRRLLFVRWLSKAPTAPNCKGVGSDEALELECDKFEALTALSTGATSENPSQLIKKGLYGPKENRALWAAVGLKLGGKKIGFSDRLSLAQSLAVGVKDLDPIIQFVLVPVLNSDIPEAYVSFRTALPRIASLKTSQEVLARRISLIKHFETTATKVVTLPWARVKVSVLSEVAQVYDDFCSELEKLSPPDGLTGQELADYKKSVKEILDPFREKGNSIRAQTLELAAEFPLKPEQVTGYVPPPDRRPAAKTPPIDVALFGRVVQVRPPLHEKWEEALRAGAWPRVSFFFQQMREKSPPSESTQSLMRGIALAVAGAQTEALAELESAHAALGPDPGAKAIGQALYEQYGRSTAWKKAKETWK